MKALHGAGFLAHHQRQAEAARDLFDESLSIARELDDRWTIAWTLHCLGRVAYFENDPETARSLGEQSLAVAEEARDPSLVAWAHHLLGLAAYIAHEDVTARAHYERSLSIRRDLGFDEGIGILLCLVGLIDLRDGDFASAHALYTEALRIMHGVLGPWNSAMPLAAMSRIAAACDQPVTAVRLGAAATALGQLYETPLIPLFEPPLAAAQEQARRALGEEAYRRAWSEGTTLPLEAAIAEAFDVEVQHRRVVPTRTDDEPDWLASLTPTELQVLRLLARGHTTKEIAAQLVCAVSTVDRHITHIYTKLDVRNRAEAAALAVEYGLARD
jgi:non-specific serine/threonine protein kinase